MIESESQMWLKFLGQVLLIVGTLTLFLRWLVYGRDSPTIDDLSKKPSKKLVEINSERFGDQMVAEYNQHQSDELWEQVRLSQNALRDFHVAMYKRAAVKREHIRRMAFRKARRSP